MPDKSRYREIEFIGGRILQARELNKLQAIDAYLDDSNLASSYGLNGIYRQGATLNVSVQISGNVVTLAKNDATKPMMVFVRDRWEMLKSLEAPSVDLGTTNNVLYLNWALTKVTSADDPDLKDATTLEDTAQMGELVLSVSATDTSGIALDTGTQFDKNTSPVILFNFTRSGGNPVVSIVDNVNPLALANGNVAGLVKLTSSDSNGVAPSSTDPRLSDERTPLDESVDTSKVKTPTQTGTNTNSDGTPVYDLGTVGQGGISSAKVIYQAGTQLVSDAISWIKSTLNALLSRFSAHETASLGLSNTHPMPTAQQVGAAPASHVNLPLGVGGSHPATVASNTAGFTVTRDVGAAATSSNYAYSVVEGATVKSGLTHNGDAYSLLSSAITVSPRVEAGETLYAGPLSLMSTMAQVLAQHVNKTSHKNPHGLVPADINAPDIPYVDAGDANAVASANSYTDQALLAYVQVRTTSFTGAAHPETLLGVTSPTNTSMSWTIAHMGKFEIAFGNGFCYNGDSVFLPETTGWSTSSMMVMPSVNWAQQHYDSDRTGILACSYRPSNNTVFVYSVTNQHTALANEWANVFAVAWRALP